MVTTHGAGVLLRDNLWNLRGKEITATVWSADAPFDRHRKWKFIDWKSVTSAVRRLQVRIAKAVKNGRVAQQGQALMNA